MNKKSNRLCNWVITALLIVALALMLSLSGCIGFDSMTNISIDAPESMEVVGRKVETLVIELSPEEADAKNVVVNLSAPPGISLTDPHTSLQQYSREFKKIPKGKKEIIYFNYSATFAGDEYSLILEVKADNANLTRRMINVNLSVPVPEWEVGEYWILNQTMGDFAGTRMQQVLRKESQNGKEVYVIKDTLAREVSGNYRIYYYAAEDLAHIKTEYYEEDKIIEKMTESIDPPSLIYDFPFKVGTKWNWNGTISGIGKTEFKGEVLEKEKLSFQGKNYNTFKIRLKYVYFLGTGVYDLWYSPDLKGVIKEKGTINIGGLTKEVNNELGQHGLPPDQPLNIQPVLHTPEGWKTYTDTDLDFRFNYPEDWKVDESSKPNIIIEDLKTKDRFFISIEPIGKMTLEDYVKKVKDNLGKHGTIEENYIEVNGRKGYIILTFLHDVWGQFYAAIFVANEKGYMIFNIYGGSYGFSSVGPDIINSFIFKEPPVYTLYERK